MKAASIAVETLLAAGVAFVLVGATTATAQKAAAPFQGPALAQDRVLSPAVETLTVSSTAFQANQPMALIYSGYGKNLSFPVSWSEGPSSTQSYAIFVEDPDTKTPEPTLHWLAYNIPAHTLSLGKGVHNSATIKGAKGMMQGLNSKGGIGYVGPHPSVGDPPHHYHVQVFALSRMLPVRPGATRDQVLAAMRDRIDAEGDLVGTFQAPQPESAAAPEGRL